MVREGSLNGPHMVVHKDTAKKSKEAAKQPVSILHQ